MDNLEEAAEALNHLQIPQGLRMLQLLEVSRIAIEKQGDTYHSNNRGEELDGCSIRFPRYGPSYTGNKSGKENHNPVYPSGNMTERGCLLHPLTPQ
jgi:hypothetical protein